MVKKAVLKFFIYVFYAVSFILTLLLLILPAWDNQDPNKVGIFLTDNNGDLDFGYMSNPQANESSIYRMTVYTVIYLCIVCLLNVAVIGLTSLDNNKVAKWLHVILCCAHATGLIFIVLIYAVRYISQLKAPLRNYYIDIFGILIDFILILLLIIFKRPKKVENDVPLENVHVEENEGGIFSRFSSKKSKKEKNNSKVTGNPQLISEGLATPLYVNGTEYVEPQPTIKAKPSTLDPNRIVVSDNVVNGEAYIGDDGNHYEYNPNQNLGAQQPVPMNTNASPILSPENNQTPATTKPSKIGSQYTYSESNAYPVTSNTVLKIPEVPEIPEVPKVDANKDRIIM